MSEVATRTTRRAGFDLHVRGGFHGGDGAGERCGDGVLHLHALDDGERVTFGDPVPGFDEDRQDERRSGAAHDATVVAEHRMRRAVDVDSQHGALHDRDDAVRPVADDDAPLVSVAV